MGVYQYGFKFVKTSGKSARGGKIMIYKNSVSGQQILISQNGVVICVNTKNDRREKYYKERGGLCG